MSGFYGDFGSYGGLYDWQKAFKDGLFASYGDEKPKQESFSAEPLIGTAAIDNGKTHGIILVPRTDKASHDEWQQKINNHVARLNDDEYEYREIVWTHYHVDGYIAYEWGSAKRFKKKYGYVHT